jgi:hypothetical protein
MYHVFEVIEEVVHDIITTAWSVLVRYLRMVGMVVRLLLVVLAFVYLWSIGKELQELGGVWDWVGWVIWWSVWVFGVIFSIEFLRRVTRKGAFLEGFYGRGGSIPFIAFDVACVVGIGIWSATYPHYEFSLPLLRLTEHIISSAGALVPDISTGGTRAAIKNMPSQQSPNVPRSSSSAINPDCTIVQRAEGTLSGNEAMRSKFVANRCKEVYFEQHDSDGIVRFYNPCPGWKVVFQKVNGSPQLWGRRINPYPYESGWIAGIADIPPEGIVVTDWSSKVDLKKFSLSPFTAVTKVMCVS